MESNEMNANETKPGTKPLITRADIAQGEDAVMARVAAATDEMIRRFLRDERDVLLLQAVKDAAEQLRNAADSEYERAHDTLADDESYAQIVADLNAANEDLKALEDERAAIVAPIDAKIQPLRQRKASLQAQREAIASRVAPVQRDAAERSKRFKALALDARKRQDAVEEERYKPHRNRK